MPTNEFLLEIKSKYNQLTKAEKRIADFVLHNSEKVLFMSISDLAESCEVGDTSVFRFCKTLKLQGYQEFKVKLSLSINIKEKSTNKKEEEDEFTHLTNDVLQDSIDSLKQTQSLLKQNDFDKAMSLLLGAKSINFFGVGASMLTAMEAMNKFLRITPDVKCVEDSHMQAMLASMLTEQDVAVVISYSGATKDSVSVAKLAKEAGASVISLTCYSKSQLTQWSDVTLLCGSREYPLQGGSTSLKISQLYLIDLLYTQFYKERYEFAVENNVSTSNSVLDKKF